jgi:N-acetylglutamate synthase-like GNAT family acetyltransferase
MDLRLTIRDATAADAALLAELVAAAFRDVAERFELTPANCPSHPSFCTAAWISAEMHKGVRFFVAEKNGAACACYGMQVTGRDACRIERLATLPDSRRAGVGSALLGHARVQAKAAGVTQVEVSVLSDHAELRRWYEKRGFVLSGTARYPHLPFEVSFLFAEV